MYQYMMIASVCVRTQPNFSLAEPQAKNKKCNANINIKKCVGCM